MNTAIKIDERICLSKAVRNPFAKIAKANRESNGTLPAEISRQMMREAIAELKEKAAEQ